MSICTLVRCRGLAKGLVVALLCFQMMSPTALYAGFGGGFRNRSVGGVSIDAHGVVSSTTVEDAAGWRKEIRERDPKAPPSMAAPVGIRKISLRKLDEAIAKARKEGHGMLPEEMLFLAGLQRIEYVLVYPEENDIVIAGPGEGWTINERGDVVGVTTGRPVMQLDDLVVALRSVTAAREEGITVSIDPTEEGRRSLDAYLGRARNFSPAVVAGIEKALGPQQVTITGVPHDSHFARVMVAADYHMKRIAMQLDPSPVEGLPSYLKLLQAQRSRSKNMTPRWWLACDYAPLGRSEDGLSWRLSGPGVKAMTEDELVVDGKVKGTGATSHAAQSWADAMNEEYEALSSKETTFGELRNLMDMCVIAALMQKEDLLGQAGLTLPSLMGADGVAIAKWHAPKTIATQCSFVRAGKEWIITASGGVDIDSWSALEKTQVDAQAAQVRQDAVAKTDSSWWWN
ncbi:MAG: DUF1598 domain-containing protein [Pirellulaceae bacterium]